MLLTTECRKQAQGDLALRDTSVRLFYFSFYIRIDNRRMTFRTGGVHRHPLPRALLSATRCARPQPFYGSRSDCQNHSIKPPDADSPRLSATVTTPTTRHSCAQLSQKFFLRVSSTETGCMTGSPYEHNERQNTSENKQLKFGPTSCDRRLRSEVLADLHLSKPDFLLLFYKDKTQSLELGLERVFFHFLIFCKSPLGEYLKDCKD